MTRAVETQSRKIAERRAHRIIKRKLQDRRFPFNADPERLIDRLVASYPFLEEENGKGTLLMRMNKEIDRELKDARAFRLLR